MYGEDSRDGESYIDKCKEKLCSLTTSATHLDNVLNNPGLVILRLKLIEPRVDDSERLNLCISVFYLFSWLQNNSAHAQCRTCSTSIGCFAGLSSIFICVDAFKAQLWKLFWWVNIWMFELELLSRPHTFSSLLCLHADYILISFNTLSSHLLLATIYYYPAYNWCQHQQSLTQYEQQ